MADTHAFPGHPWRVLQSGGGSNEGAGTVKAQVSGDGTLFQIGPLKIKKLSLPIVAATTVNDTDFDLPAKGVVLDVWVDVATAEATGATKTIEVGLLASETGGDEDGFLDAVSVAATGAKRGVATITTGANENFFASTTRGALLASLTAGTDAAGDVGTYYEKPHILNGTAKSVTYTLASDDWAEFVGSLYIMYIDLD